MDGRKSRLTSGAVAFRVFRPIYGVGGGTPTEIRRTMARTRGNLVSPDIGRKTFRDCSPSWLRIGNRSKPRLPKICGNEPGSKPQDASLAEHMTLREPLTHDNDTARR